jgi:hypothetical protein
LLTYLIGNKTAANPSRLIFYFDLFNVTILLINS